MKTYVVLFGNLDGNDNYITSIAYAGNNEKLASSFFKHSDFDSISMWEDGQEIRVIEKFRRQTEPQDFISYVVIYKKENEEPEIEYMGCDSKIAQNLALSPDCIKIEIWKNGILHKKATGTGDKTFIFNM